MGSIGADSRSNTEKSGSTTIGNITSTIGSPIQGLRVFGDWGSNIADFDFLGTAGTQAMVNTGKVISGEEEFGQHKDWVGGKDISADFFNTMMGSRTRESQAKWDDYYATLAEQQQGRLSSKGDPTNKYKNTRSGKRDKNIHGTVLFPGDEETDTGSLL